MKTPLGFFKPKDFGNNDFSIRDVGYLADIANTNLNKALGPIVYFKPTHQPYKSYSETKYEWCTHQAYLFNIQEIIKDPCKHEPKSSEDATSMSESECIYCGVPLVAEWRENK